jgi:hypothetical protein
MGATNQYQIEQAEREYAARVRKHDRGCPVCSNELELDDCEALQWAADKDD